MTGSDSGSVEVSYEPHRHKILPMFFFFFYYLLESLTCLALACSQVPFFQYFPVAPQFKGALYFTHIRFTMHSIQEHILFKEIQ